MMLFFVIARDGTDAGAQARRQAVREAHLLQARELHDSGVLLTGGAILSPDEKMIGSVLLIEAESEAQVREVLEKDAYTTGGVWETFEILPFKRAL